MNGKTEINYPGQLKPVQYDSLRLTLDPETQEAFLYTPDDDKPGEILVLEKVNVGIFSNESIEIQGFCQKGPGSYEAVKIKFTPLGAI